MTRMQTMEQRTGHSLAPVVKGPNGGHVEGGKYWIGYWNTWYTVDKIHQTPSGWAVTVTWADGHQGAHCTTLDPKWDYRILN